MRGDAGRRVQLDSQSDDASDGCAQLARNLGDERSVRRLRLGLDERGDRCVRHDGAAQVEQEVDHFRPGDEIPGREALERLVDHRDDPRLVHCRSSSLFDEAYPRRASTSATWDPAENFPKTRKPTPAVTRVTLN